jgi:MYXO-CTERM domain-containing protein
VLHTNKLSLVWSLVLLLLLGTASTPVVAQTTDPGTTGRDMDDDGFDDWGLLGLLGLAGLLGRKREHRDVVEPRRV